MFSHFLAEDVPLADALLAGYSLAFFFAFMLFRAASKGQHQERFLDYRALAEALRVAVFWKLVGIGSPRLEETPSSDVRIAIRSVAEAYPIRQPSELAWVKVCLRNLDLLDAAARSPHPLSQADHLLARSLWVYGQYRYFLRQGLRHDHTAESWERFAGFLFALAPFGLAFALIALDVPVFHLGPEGWLHGEIRHYTIFVMGMLPALAAVLVGYTEKLAFSAQARQYDRMRMLFDRGYRMLPPTIDDQTAPLAQALYAELGTEAMKENAEWVAIYRQRPIRPPHA